MFVYTFLEALVGIVAGILLAVLTKKSRDVVYGKLDKIGRFTNIILLAVYLVLSPLYLFLGALSEPGCEGILWVVGLIVGVIASSAALICGLGLGASVALRKKGKSGLSFAVQFAGAAGIALTILLYVVFAGNLLSSLN